MQEVLNDSDEDVSPQKLRLGGAEIASFNQAFMKDVGQFAPKERHQLDDTKSKYHVDIQRALDEGANIDQLALDSLKTPTKRKIKDSMRRRTTLDHLYKLEVYFLDLRLYI